MHPLAHMIREIYAYRELLLALTYRDIRVKYKQAVMGILWAFFLPVVAIASGLVFRFAMAYFSGKDLLIVDLIAVMVKTVPWLLFAGVVGSSSNSLITNLGLITKIYFPREVMPLSNLLSALFDFTISVTGLIVVLSLISFFSGETVSPVVVSANLLLVPVFLGTLLVMAAAAGLTLSCANLFFRDVKYIVQVTLQFGIMFSLVYFTYSELGQWGWVLLINPVAPLLEGIRMAVIEGGIEPFLWPWLGYSATVAFVGLVIGTSVFEKAEYLFAEYV